MMEPGPTIRIAILDDLAEWAALRQALWSSSSIMDHRDEILAVLRAPTEQAVAFVAAGLQTRLCGFAEARIRRDYVNGCDTSPVAFLEGIYVTPDARGQGIGRELGAAVEAWGRERGCMELASDALLGNLDSQVFHGAVGFEETERVVFFRKRL